MFLLVLVVAAVLGASHRYEQNDKVPMLVNSVGPFASPSETYNYYSLPLCKPDKVETKTQSLGEVLEGSEKSSSLYDVRFKVDIQWQSLCQKTLSKQDVADFRRAISQYYYGEMFFDDLPVWFFIGSVASEDDADADDAEFYLFKHLHFTVLYNDDQVVKINCTADTSKVVLLEKDAADVKVEFSYSAEWHRTEWPFARRMELYEDSFFAPELEIHWLSIMNSCVLVVLLTGFLTIIIMRVLKSDYARYSRAEDEEDDAEDYGWKLIHGDVFRFPPYKSLFTALQGVGAQLLLTAMGVLTLALAGAFYPNNGGAIYTSLICLYSLTSVVGGYVSGKLYKQMGGEAWSWNIVMQATAFMLPTLVVFSVVNSVAWAHKATTALPVTTIILIVAIWLIVAFPLAVLGGIAGRHNAGTFDAPVRTKNFPREIPPVPWYRAWYVQMLLSGFLPFSSIYIELYYVFSSLYGHSSYQLFGILALVFIILIVVTACITVALTYFTISSENWRWQWSAFCSAGAPAGFIYAYAVFYYFQRSKLVGVVQGTFFFMYSFLISLFFFYLLGFVGWYASLRFVRMIYSNIKTD